MQENYEDAVR